MVITAMVAQWLLLEFITFSLAVWWFCRVHGLGSFYKS